MIRYGVVGAGGYGREVMPLVRSMVSREVESGAAALCFLVEGGSDEPEVNGIRVASLEGFLEEDGDKRFCIAIADSHARERLARRLVEAGARPFPVVAQNSVMMDANVIGEGCIFSPFTTVTSNVRIGAFFQANIYSYIGHDCRIGDYVTFAPSVQCNGRVVIEDHAYIGTGAIIKPGTREAPMVIGHGSVVGMGSVVTKPVPPLTTVVGNPARHVGTK